MEAAHQEGKQPSLTVFVSATGTQEPPRKRIGQPEPSCRGMKQTTHAANPQWARAASRGHPELRPDTSPHVVARVVYQPLPYQN